MTGFEPATSASRTHGTRITSPTLSVVTTTPAGTSATTSPKRQKYDVESTDPLPITGDLKAALLMIERLPLSDAEKAEAIRRLLASHGVRHRLSDFRAFS